MSPARVRIRPAAARACALATALACLIGAGSARGITFCELGDAPALVPGLPTMGAGPLERIFGTLADSADVDVYRIFIVNPAAFSATVVGGAAFDTQLFLFDLAGVGVAHDDDTPPGAELEPTITGALVPAPGTYYLAITAFDRDPVNPPLNLVWLEDPTSVERAPDGPGAPGPLAGWTGFGDGPGGNYWIQLSGCAPSAPGPMQPGVWLEAGDAPDLIPGEPTAGLGSLTRIFGVASDSGDVDLYRIRIPNPAAFSATTVGGEFEDTQLFLLSASGLGIAFDDDRPDGASALSQLSGALVPSAGSYFLAVSEFARMPASAGGSIWLADPGCTERAPDGPGAAGALTGWTNGGSLDGGFYGVLLTGAEFDDGTVGVGEGPPRTSALRLEARPNPSHRTVTITYSAPAAGPVRVRILDMQGRRVRTLLEAARAEATRSLPWDGRDERGAAVAAGVYVVELEAGDQAPVRKAVVIR